MAFDMDALIADFRGDQQPASHRDVALKSSRRASKNTRDIGEIPYVVNADRKDRGCKSLTSFCREYQPTIFTRPFAPIHKEVISRLEAAILHGGLFSYAMPRGVGKTCIAEAACIWAILTGKRRYVALISATEKHAQQSLTNIKKELSTNELILEDWPEVVYPIWALENISHRASGQLYQDAPTYIIWRGEQLVLPSIPESKAAGSVIEIRGITGAIRGMKVNLPGGRGSVRPELVILDDPQTDESARSASQCATREQIILGTILGLAGHEHEISVAMPCTVIHKGDLAERFLNRDTRPEWHGTRSRLLTSMPKNMKFWDEYNELRGEGEDVAKQYYVENREVMDAGAEPVWKECYTPKQLSAIQYAMDLKFRVGEQAFWAEYQNEPLDDVSDGEIITAEEICAKVTKYTRYQIPENCQHLTCFIDVHKSLLYYMVCAWEENFNGYIIDYGTWPDAKRVYFSLREMKGALQGMYPGKGLDGSIYAGLEALTDKLLTKTWGKSKLYIKQCTIDANWKTSLVKSFCRETKLANVILPGHGRYIGADRRPLNEYKKHTGDRVGWNWRIPAALDRGGSRHIIFDNNYWKTFSNSALLSPPGERGCLQLPSGMDLRLLADHLTSEYFTEVSAKGRTVNQWIEHPGHDDNHWWDCLVGCAVGASILGCVTIDTTKHQRAPMRVRYLE